MGLVGTKFLPPCTQATALSPPPLSLSFLYSHPFPSLSLIAPSLSLFSSLPPPSHFLSPTLLPSSPPSLPPPSLPPFLPPPSLPPSLLPPPSISSLTDGYTGDMYLLVKLLLPTAGKKRVYNVQSKQIVKHLSQVSPPSSAGIVLVECLSHQWSIKENISKIPLSVYYRRMCVGSSVYLCLHYVHVLNTKIGYPVHQGRDTLCLA